MSRTKKALLAVLAAAMDPFGPDWLRVILSVLSLVGVAYVCWYLWSDTEPSETYTQKVGGHKARVRR